MSALVGLFPPRGYGRQLGVSSSRGGVEIAPANDELVTLTPLEARAFAAALVVAAEEVERVRRNPPLEGDAP